MKFNYKQAANKSGIYEIKNLLSNKSYIGSAKEFKSRWFNHASSLKINKHSNKHLQHSFIKYLHETGNNDFIEFNVLER